MKDNIIITGYKDMCFTTGEGKDKSEVDFLKLSCLTSNSGIDSIGYLPTQYTYMGKDKVNILGSLKEVPGLYEAEYSVVPGKNNKPSLQVVGFIFVKPIDLKSCFDSKKVI